MSPNKGKRNPANQTNQPSDNSNSNIKKKTKASVKKTETKATGNKNQTKASGNTKEFKVASLKKSEKKKKI